LLPKKESRAALGSVFSTAVDVVASGCFMDVANVAASFFACAGWCLCLWRLLHRQERWGSQIGRRDRDGLELRPVHQSGSERCPGDSI
jgi:hypothetical protein